MFTNPFINNPKKGKKYKLVCIGGGNAMPMALLSQLRNHNVKITVISAVLDSGGSSGKIRKDYSVLAFGDLRRAFLELSDFDPFIKKVLNHRFEEGDIKGHNLGNLLMLSFYLNVDRSYSDMFRKVNQFLRDDFKIYPSTAFSSAELNAVLENGEVIAGETNIDVPKHDPNLKIKDMFLNPKAEICPHSAEAIEEADAVIIGPGDIYSSLVQILLVGGLKEAVKRSKAKTIYVCNSMTKNGESNGFSVTDFTGVIEKYLGSPLDYVVYNKRRISEEGRMKIRKKHPELLEMVKIDKGLDKGKFIGEDLIVGETNPDHNPKNLVRTIMELVKR
jgi:uncharacterized cofD-like protein